MQKKLTEYIFLTTIICIPSYLIKFSLFSIPLNVLELLAIISIISFILNVKYYPFKINLFNIRSIYIGIFFLFLGIISSLFYADNFSLYGLSIIKSWFLIPIIFSYCASLIFRDIGSLTKIFFALYLSSLIVSIIAIIYALLGVTTYDNRLAAFYGSPNQLSMYVVFGLLVFPYLYNLGRTISYKILIIISALPILTTLYLTLSYSLWFSVILSYILILIIKFNITHYKKYILSLIIIFVLFFSFQLKSDKLTNIFDSRSSLSSRTMIWNSASLLIRDNIFFGIGPGNFQNKYLSYQKFFSPYLEWAVPHPHNLYMSFWLQTGLTGFISFLFISINFIIIWIKNKNTIFSVVFLSFIFYVLIHGLFDTTYWKNDLSYIFWLLVMLGSNNSNYKHHYKLDKLPPWLYRPE